MGAGEDLPADAVLEDHFVKIDDQTYGYIDELHLAQNLGFVDREN